MLIRGGGGGIRTRDTVSRIHTFQACAFDRSATPPARAPMEKSEGEAHSTGPAARASRAHGGFAGEQPQAGRSQKRIYRQHECERRRIFQIHSPMDIDFQKEESSRALQATPSLAKPIGVRREAIYRSRRGIRRLLSEPDEDARDEYTRPANRNALPKENPCSPSDRTTSRRMPP